MKSIDKIVEDLCPGLSIYEINVQDPAAKAELDLLYEEICRIKGRLIRLFDSKPEFRIHARLPEHQGIVGYAALTREQNGEYCTSTYIHPRFENRRIATALSYYRIEIAKQHPNIKLLRTMVIPGSPTDKIAQRLGFRLVHTIDLGDSEERNVYELDVN